MFAIISDRFSSARRARMSAVRSLIVFIVASFAYSTGSVFRSARNSSTFGCVDGPTAPTIVFAGMSVSVFCALAETCGSGSVAST